MGKITKKLFNVLGVFCCILCNLALTTTLIVASAPEENSQLVLVSSSPETLDANGALVRTNKIFHLENLSQSDINAIAQRQDNVATDVLKKICSSYIEVQSGETDELLYLLNCRKEPHLRMLIDRTANEFKLSENYSISPFKLFFIGLVSKNLDLNSENLDVQKNDFVKNIVKDYTGQIMGAMPTEIVGNYAENSFSLLKGQIKERMAGYKNRLNLIAQAYMMFFGGLVNIYNDALNNCNLSIYNVEALSTYNLIYKYLRDKFRALDEFQKEKKLIKLKGEIMDIAKENANSNLKDKLERNFKDDIDATKILHEPEKLMRIAEQIYITDIVKGFTLQFIEELSSYAISRRMELVTEKLRKLFIGFTHLLQYKNN